MILNEHCDLEHLRGAVRYLLVEFTVADRGELFGSTERVVEFSVNSAEITSVGVFDVSFGGYDLYAVDLSRLVLMENLVFAVREHDICFAAVAYFK